MKIMGITDRTALKSALAMTEEMEQELATATDAMEPARYVALLRKHDTALANLLYERGAEILTAPAYAAVASAIYSHVWRCENNSNLPSKLTEGALRIIKSSHAASITPVKFYPRGGKVSFVASVRVQDITDETERAMMVQVLSEAHITYLLTQSQYANLIIRLYGEESALPALSVRVGRNAVAWEAHRTGSEKEALLSRKSSLFDVLCDVIPEAGPRDRRVKSRHRAWQSLKLPMRSALPSMSMSLCRVW